MPKGRQSPRDRHLELQPRRARSLALTRKDRARRAPDGAAPFPAAAALHGVSSREGDPCAAVLAVWESERDLYQGAGDGEVD